LIIVSLVSQCHSISFRLLANSKRCLLDTAQKNELVTGEYSISETPLLKTHIKVTDSKKDVLYKNDGTKQGKFAITLDHPSSFEVCFKSHLPPGSGHDITYVIKRGVEAKNYEQVKEAEKLKPMELELRRLHDLSQELVEDFVYMRNREEEMRDTNESTHARVLYFSLFSMCCLLVLASWQLYYLRRYFKAKKLID
ncbi:uncharacterized protein TRIADDRAFT_6732, partial [Trichoplax adhaerens]